MLHWFEEDRDYLFVFDDGSSITCINNESLFLPGSIVSISPVRVRNSSDLYSRINRSGEVVGFGNVYYDGEQFISIVCAHDVERDVNFDVIEKKNTNGKRIGYDIVLKSIGVTLYARWQGKIMIGSFRPLFEYIMSGADGQQRPPDNNFLLSEVTNSRLGAKASKNLQTMARAERAVNRVRKIQYRMGFMSDEHASVAAKSGFFSNLPVSASDFRYATAVAGPDIAMMKGKGVVDRQMEYYDLVPELKDGELLVEIDLGYIGQHCFLIGITLPFNYSIAIYLGNQKGIKKAENLYHAIMELKRVIAEYGYRIRFLVFDSERSLAKDHVPIDVFSVKDRLADEGIICQQLPPGVHAKRVERKIGHWKGKIRSCNFRLLYSIPQSWIPHLGIAAMIWCNMDPTDANVNMSPPLYLIRGESIDAKKLCVASFGEIVLSPVDNGVAHNSTSKGRKLECIYLYPKTSRGSHKLLVLDSIDGSRVQAIYRDVKSSEVLPYVPISVISRINKLAKLQMNDKHINSLPSSDIEEIRELTGFQEDSIVEAPIDLLRRDSNTVSMVEETVAYMKDDSWSDKLSYMITHERECFFSIGEMGSDEAQFSFAIKKELPFAKAMKELNAVKVEESMKEEFTGLVSKWHPVNLVDIPKIERKDILPGHGLVKEKSDDRIKGRFVGGGNRQDRGKYDIYREISTPTASLSSFFAVAAHAASRNLAIGSFDVKQAFTKAPMPIDSKKIRVRLTKSYVNIIKSISQELNDLYESFQSDDGSVIVELDYALYGTLEAGRIWYDYFRGILVNKLGYKVSAHDDCVFNMFNSDGIIISTIVVHVDDGFVTGSDESVLDTFFEKLTAELGELTIRRGRVHEYLGMLLDFSQPSVVHITIEKMIQQLISDWNVSKKRNSPARSDLFSIDESSQALNEASSKQLHRGIAQLLYLSTHVRPDVLCATIFLTSRVQNLTQQDFSKFMDILSYLNYTTSLGIMLGGDSKNQLRLYAFADASFGVHYDGRSQGGTYISYGRGPILTRSNKLKEVPKSSSESELMQLSDTCSLAAKERDFAIEQQHIDVSEKGILLEDNKSAIHMANNGKSISNRTRHIKVRYFFVKQYLDNGEFRLEHCPTKEMIADILTKPLQGELFLELRDLLLGYEALSR